MKLFFIRHGETEANLPTWKEAGIFDVGLTERGFAQAKAVAEWSAVNLPVPDLIVSSTLLRAKQTADFIASAWKTEYETDDRIREVGLCWADGTPVPADGSTTYTHPWLTIDPGRSVLTDPNGENLFQLRGRLASALQSWQNQYRGKVIYVVSHGFAIDGFIDIIYGASPYRSAEVWTANTGIAYIQLIEHPNREKWRIHYINRVEHLAQVGGLDEVLGGESTHWYEE